jgi:hypothetical protein
MRPCHATRFKQPRRVKLRPIGWGSNEKTHIHHALVLTATFGQLSIGNCPKEIGRHLWPLPKARTNILGILPEDVLPYHSRTEQGQVIAGAQRYDFDARTQAGRNQFDGNSPALNQ